MKMLGKILAIIHFILIFQNILLAQCFKPSGAYKQVGFNTPASPLIKPGWNLIFNDEFNDATLAAQKWSKSTNLDDGYHNCLHNIVLNPANVGVSDGYLNLTLNTTDYAGCSNSGAEIKSYSTQDPTFRNIAFYPGSYVEVRVKNLPFAEGAGSAFWLFRGGDGLENREIDIWETYGANKTNLLKTNYHWDKVDDEDASESQRIYLYKDLFITPYNLDYEWVNIGCEWHHNVIRFYVNNTLVRELNVTGENNAGEPFDPVDQPLNIKLGIQSPLCATDPDDPDESALPKTMYVDYIRVYKQCGTMASPFTYLPNSICFNSIGANMYCVYYPDATYAWVSEAFDFVPNGENIQSARWATLKSGITPGNHYNVSVTITFPEGYIETNTQSVYISEFPQIPNGTISTLQQGTSCFYWAKTEQDNEEENILWSTNGGITWNYGETFYANGKYWSKYGEFLKDKTYNVKLKTENVCGVSESSTSKTFTTPNPGGCWLRTEQVILQMETPDTWFSPTIVNGFIYYDLNYLDYSQKVKILIYNLIGEIVYNEFLTADCKINLGNISDGFYISIAQSISGTILNTHKFYKN